MLKLRQRVKEKKMSKFMIFYHILLIFGIVSGFLCIAMILCGIVGALS